MREILGNYSHEMKLADLHVHTNESPDVHEKGMNADEVVRFAELTGLSSVAITDHHSVREAYKARDYAARSNSSVEIVVGIEVDTKQGHVIGLFLEDPITRADSAEEAIDEIHKQGGIAIIPHPFMKPILRKYPAGIGLHDLDAMRNSGITIDGFEVYSQGAEDVSIVRRMDKDSKSNNLAEIAYNLFRENLGAPIASSDAHGLTLGRARTAYEGNLREAIEQKLTSPIKLNRDDDIKIIHAALDLFGFERLSKSTSKLRRNLLRGESYPK